MGQRKQRENLVIANKNPGIFCDMQSFFCFFLYKGTKFFVVVKQVPVLIAVTGENIGDQRLRSDTRRPSS